MTGAADQDRRRPRLRRRVGEPVEVPGRPLLDLHRLLRPQARLLRGRRGLHQQAAGRRRLPLLVPRHRGGARHRARRPTRSRRSSGMDPAELRMKNFIQPEQFPYKSALGWEYDSGNYPAALKKAMEMIDYDALRKEQAEKRKRGRADGHRHLELHRDRRRRAVASTSTSSASRCSTRPRSASTRPARRSRASAPRRRARATRRRTRRSSPRSSASRPRRPGRGGRHRHRALRARHLRQPLDADRRRGRRDGRAQDPRQGAQDRGAPARGRARSDLEWEPGKFSVKGAPQKSKTIQEIAFAAYTNHPQGMEAGLEAIDYYDPPNLTFPFGSYICVVDIDRGTGRGQGAPLRRGRRLRQHHQPDDRRRPDPRRARRRAWRRRSSRRSATTRTATTRPAASWTTSCRPRWRRRTGRPTRPSRPRRTIRSAPRASASRPPSARRRRSPTRWSTRCRHLGVTHIDIPITPEKVWQILKEKGVAE